MTRNRDDFGKRDALRSGLIGLVVIFGIMAALGSVIDESKEHAARKVNSKAAGHVTFTVDTPRVAVGARAGSAI